MITRFFRTFFFLLTNASAWTDGADWEPEDALALSGFLASRTGIKFSARLRNASLSFNANAVQSGQPHECGRAFGYMTAIADIQTLSAPSMPRDAQSEEDGATGVGSLEHLIP